MSEEINGSYKNMIDKMSADSFINEQLDALRNTKPLGKYRAIAKELVEKYGYSNDPVTIALSICEESGEVGKSVNWFENPLYIHSPHGREPESIEHELNDVLVYAARLANALNLDLDF